ncbi:MAG TPA: aconitate hydratase AcnA [Anaerolineae bacterium]|nr:aconitate hydratase AcnA [Anaerolineae bacterium]
MANPSTGDLFGARRTLGGGAGELQIYWLDRLEELGIAQIGRLPFSIRIWLESLLRLANGRQVTEAHVVNLAHWSAQTPGSSELPFMPGRVLLQDFTGVPAIVDLAAMRAALSRWGGDPVRVNPEIPVDLVIDHSVQVDEFGIECALQRNSELEFQRNRERYEFLHWAQGAIRNLRVVPPATGICHQVNLEYLATVVTRKKDSGGRWIAFPDTLVGTDSHTTMINGLGVVGWGVGGIEAEAAMLGEPITLLPPEVVGMELVGTLPHSVTATDLVLTLTQMLRRAGVVGKFVEFFGAGASRLSLPDRATVANMAPEYGATMGFFPVDDETLRYLRSTGREPAAVDLVEYYTKEQGLFRSQGLPAPDYSQTLHLDLTTVETSLAGPKRPQDRVPHHDAKRAFRVSLTAPVSQLGHGLDERDLESLDRRMAPRAARPGAGTGGPDLDHGAVVIAAITSCTNTSNPEVMLAAGLLAKKAVEHGLHVPGYVKTSLAPGSTVVPRYLEAAGLMPYLEQLGFHLAGYGCTTCIGNSGPLPAAVAEAIRGGDLVAVAVLSGNRNFEGRVHPLVRANYLASPPLVVAYALAGTMDVDMAREPLGFGSDGRPVFLSDIWPSRAEVQDLAASRLEPRMFVEQYAGILSGNEMWNAMPSAASQDLYAWDPASTYVREPPFFARLGDAARDTGEIRGARVLAFLGDSVTTDHISPAGDIAGAGPAGRFLLERGVPTQDFNSYGSRRGNHEVMMRGTFANVRLKNRLVPGVEGGVTLYHPTGEVLSIYDAAMRFLAAGTPLVVLAGKEYGTGSSRDWAAKGTYLLGVKAVLAESYERIHRSNLVGMGVLPLQFRAGENAVSLGLTGEEVLDIRLDSRRARSTAEVHARRGDGTLVTFGALVRLDTPVEVEYHRNGGILNTVARRLLG